MFLFLGEKYSRKRRGKGLTIDTFPRVNSGKISLVLSQSIEKCIMRNLEGAGGSGKSCNTRREHVMDKVLCEYARDFVRKSVEVEEYIARILERWSHNSGNLGEHPRSTEIKLNYLITMLNSLNINSFLPLFLSQSSYFVMDYS